MIKIHYIHLDTVLVQDYIWDDGEAHYDAECLFKVLYSSLYQGYIKIKFSFVGVGELVNNYCRDNLKDQDCSLKELYKFLKKFKIDLIPAKGKSCELAMELNKKDHEIENTDALLVAQSLFDRKSSYFLTRDKQILESSVIKDIEKELRQKNKRDRRIYFSPEYGEHPQS